MPTNTTREKGVARYDQTRVFSQIAIMRFLRHENVVRLESSAVCRYPLQIHYFTRRSKEKYNKWKKHGKTNNNEKV